MSTLNPLARAAPTAHLIFPDHWTLYVNRTAEGVILVELAFGGIPARGLIEVKLDRARAKILAKALVAAATATWAERQRAWRKANPKLYEKQKKRQAAQRRARRSK